MTSSLSVALLLILTVDVWAVSQWEPFCNEKLLYRPYIRIYKGRNGPLLRDYGPGYIETSRLSNIYICTNGLVMMYYTRTESRYGQVLEQGELQYSAHTCQLYNPTPCFGTIFQGKRLRALLLISHPKDYRLPALQMFIAPSYNEKMRAYLNLTSLLMISSEGECILEKGEEKARIRVRAVEPKSVEEYKDDPKPAVFCLLDPQLRDEDGDDDWLPLKYPESAAPDVMKAISREVLDSLTVNKPIKFTGCLRYPNFNVEQMRTIKQFNEIVNSDKFGPDNDKAINPSPGNSEKFWTVEVEGKSRLELYKVSTNKLTDDINSTRLTMETAKKEYDDSAPADKQAKGEAYKLAKIDYLLHPYRNAYGTLYDSLEADATAAKGAWTEVFNEIEKADEDGVNATFSSYLSTNKEIQQLIYDRRYNPYNPEMVSELTNLTNMSTTLLKRLKALSVKLGPMISKAETIYRRYVAKHGFLKSLMHEYQQAILRIEKGNLNFVYKEIPQPAFDVPVEIMNPEPDPADPSPEQGAPCKRLPPLKETCEGIKPTLARACSLLSAVKGKLPSWPQPEVAHLWRDNIFELISQIFDKACPYIDKEFSASVNRVVKGYLLGSPKGTGLKGPVEGSRLDQVSGGMMYHGRIYNETEESVGGNLTPFMDPFWNIIQSSLEDCLSLGGGIEPLEFYMDIQGEGEEEEEKIVITMKRKFPNGSSVFLNMEKVYMSEQADIEYSFNWAIDTSWRIFSTVLGICMPKYEARIPLISARFYALYTEAFLGPIRQIWMSNRDNSVFNVIFGRYYPTGKADRWTRNCMEASFIQSGDVLYRPPRKMMVNGFTEMNFFTKGPMAGGRGFMLENAT